jgi:small subunit ribosomal protein S5
MLGSLRRLAASPSSCPHRLRASIAGPLPLLSHFASIRFYSDSSSQSPANANIEQSDTPKQPSESVEQSSPRFRYDLPFPDLSEPEPLYDQQDVMEIPPTKRSPYPSKVIVRNDPSMFVTHRQIYPREEPSKAAPGGEEGTGQAAKPDDKNRSPHHPLSQAELRSLHRYTLMVRRVAQQTGKGKIFRLYALVVVGNGNGLVGHGEAKDVDAVIAIEKAFLEAVRNMDYVDRFEERTIWSEMQSKMGATRIILRPRPVGFGLHCNPNIHQVLKAAGIKDISAKVWGSRNPINVIKLVFRMMHAGNAPLAMGDGVGGKGRKLDKGSGLRSRQEVERERGRKLLSLRTR